MKADSITQHSVDVGISQISQHGAVDRSEFKAEQTWRAPPGVPSAHLKTLFEANTVEHQIERYLKPAKVNWFLLVPVHFKALRREMLKRLSNGKVNSNQVDERLLRAAELLSEEEQHLALLDRYRFSLVKA